MDHSLSLITSQGNLEKKKAVLYTDGLHPYFMATAQSRNRKGKPHHSKTFAYCSSREGRDWKLQMDDFLMIYHSTLH